MSTAVIKRKVLRTSHAHCFISQLVTVQTDYGDCYPYIVQYIAIHSTDTLFYSSQGTKIAAGYVDGSVRVYDLHTQMTVASFLLPLLVPSKNKPYGTVGPESNQGPSSPNTKLVGLPPPSGIVFLQTGNERNEPILVVADVAGRLTSCSTTPKLPTSDGAALHGNGLDMEPPRSTSNRVAIGSELASFASEPGGKKKTPAPPKKPKSGPGGFPSLDMLGGIKGSDGNAPVFSLSGTATGDGVVILAGLRCNNSENSGSAMSEVSISHLPHSASVCLPIRD